MKILVTILFILTALQSLAQLTEYEKSNAQKTATYEQCISFYNNLTKTSKQIKMQAIGVTDGGEPLHLVTLSTNAQHNPVQWHQQGKAVILIINGIHPGEPDGIDASMMLARDILNKKYVLPANVCIGIIPIYNIGGAQQRSKYLRVDQNGPEEFGTRGNAQYLDLNRDFIKCDSRDARSFAQIFHYLKPDVLVDNHVSNGADYQHIMTLITSQHNKLGNEAGAYIHNNFEPALYSMMKLKGYDLVPYVNNFNNTPQQGWQEFLEGPRYSTGYATLFNCFGFVPETHMLKPYQQRVEATLALEKCFIEYCANNASTIKATLQKTHQSFLKQTQHPLDWAIDSTQHSLVTFMGYQSSIIKSQVTGFDRLFYDRTKPYTQQVKFYNQYKPKNIVRLPKAYIIPKGWWRVIELLKINQVQMQVLTNKQSIAAKQYRITNYKSSAQPYEMHHSNNNIETEELDINYLPQNGDYLVPVNQPAARFIVEVLEPTGRDSYFAWNFFDGILGQKEGYSPYVFEEKALELLQDPEFKQKYEQAIANNPDRLKTGSQRLDWIFYNSKYYEARHNKYPVLKVF
jgi:hypothetical protein